MDPGSFSGSQKTARDPVPTGLHKLVHYLKLDALSGLMFVCFVYTCGMIVILFLRSCRPIVEISILSMRMEPSAASIILNRQFVRLDFPAPVRPTMPICVQSDRTLKEKQLTSFHLGFVKKTTVIDRHFLDVNRVCLNDRKHEFKARI